MNFFIEENRQVKTDLGECNLKVTHPDGKCSEILVSNPKNTDIVRATHIKF